MTGRPWRWLAWIATTGSLVLTSASVGAQTGAPPSATAPAGPPPAAGSSPPTAAAPVVPADRGRFAAVWVTPIASDHFQGAGAEAGYRYRWLAGLYRIGFLQNGYAPVDEMTPLLTLERKQRLLLELEVDGQLRFHDQITVGVGAGAAFFTDRVDIASTTGQTWTTVTDNRGRIRPLVSVTLAGPIFQASLTAYVGSDSEARFSFGVCWGRHARR